MAATNNFKVSVCLSSGLAKWSWLVSSGETIQDLCVLCFDTWTKDLVAVGLDHASKIKLFKRADVDVNKTPTPIGDELDLKRMLIPGEDLVLMMPADEVGAVDRATVSRKRKRATEWKQGPPATLVIPPWARVTISCDSVDEIMDTDQRDTFVNRTTELRTLAQVNIRNMAFAAGNAIDQASRRPVPCALHAFGAGKTALGWRLADRMAAEGYQAELHAWIEANISPDLRERAHAWANFDNCLTIHADLKEAKAMVITSDEAIEFIAWVVSKSCPPGGGGLWDRIEATLQTRPIVLIIDEVGHLADGTHLSALRDWLSASQRGLFKRSQPAHGLFLYMCGRTAYAPNSAGSHDNVTPSAGLFCRITLESLNAEHVAQIIVLRGLNFPAADVQDIAGAVASATGGVPRQVQRLLTVLAMLRVGSSLAAERGGAGVAKQVEFIASAYARHESLGNDYWLLLKGTSDYLDTIARRAAECVRATVIGGPSDVAGHGLQLAQLQSQYMPFSLRPAPECPGGFLVTMSLVFLRAVHGALWMWMLNTLALQYFPQHGDLADSREIDVLVAMLRVLMPAALSVNPSRFAEPAFAVENIPLVDLLGVLLPDDVRAQTTQVVPRMVLKPRNMTFTKTEIAENQIMARLEAESAGLGGAGFVCRPQPQAECADVFVYLGAGVVPRVIEFQVKALIATELEPPTVRKEVLKCIKLPGGATPAAAASDCELWHFLLADVLGEHVQAAVSKAGGVRVDLAGGRFHVARTQFTVPAGVALFVPTSEKFAAWQPPRAEPSDDAIGVRPKP